MNAKIKTFPLEADETCSQVKVYTFPLYGQERTKQLKTTTFWLTKWLFSPPLLNTTQTEPVLNRHLFDLFFAFTRIVFLILKIELRG